MRNKKILSRGIVIVLIGVIVLLLNYIQYTQYTEGLRNDAIKLERFYTSYYAQHKELCDTPKNKKDVEKMLSWQRKISREKNLELNFLKYGYNVKNETKGGIITIYCFGQNKKDDKLIDCNGNKILLFSNRPQILTLDFFSYYFNTKNDDIEILTSR